MTGILASLLSTATSLFVVFLSNPAQVKTAEIWRADLAVRHSRVSSNPGSEGVWDTPRGALLARSVLVGAAMLVGAAAEIRTWATAYLGSEIVFDLNLHTNRLVADGPYRYVGNPL